MLAALCLAMMSALAQAPHPGALLQRMEALEHVGRALYVTARPGEENGPLLAWLAQGRRVRTGLLTVTRGGATGPEPSPRGALASVLESERARMARAVDGVEWWTTAAMDLGGASKAAALTAWDEEATLGDVVMALRTLRPHVVVVRAPAPGDGVAEATAQLAQAAFEAAGDPSRFPDQLKALRPWSPVRLVMDVGHLEDTAEGGAQGDLLIDVGGYAPLLGMSLPEIAQRAALAGGRPVGPYTPGPQVEILRPTLGAAASFDLFEGVTLGWAAIRGGGAVSAALAEARTTFRPQAPHGALPALARALEAAKALGDPDLRAWAVARIEDLMVDCAGLELEARGPRFLAPGAEAEIELLAGLRGRREARLRAAAVEIAGAEAPTALSLEPTLLNPQAVWRAGLKVQVPEAAPITVAPWLSAPPVEGRYTVAEGASPIEGEAPAPLVATFTLEIAEAVIQARRPVMSTDGRGQVWRAMITPPAWIVDLPPATFADEKAGATLSVRLGASAKVEAKVEAKAPRRWKVTQRRKAVKLRPDRGASVALTATPKGEAKAGPARVSVEVAGRSWHWAAVEIPALAREMQTGALLLYSAEIALVPHGLKAPREPVPYFGARSGEVVAALQRIGVSALSLDPARLEDERLSRWPALILAGGLAGGEIEPAVARRLKAYVRQGGRLVLLGGAVAGAAPKSIEIGEQPSQGAGALTVSVARQPWTSRPHRLSAEDFQGWARPVALATRWADGFSSLVEIKTGEGRPQKGGLLALSFGRGYVIYCGLDLEGGLLSGAPGAYRVLVDALSAEP